MLRTLLIAALGVLAVSLPGGATGFSSASPLRAQATPLTAQVGPGTSISLRNADGSSVRNLPAGDYTITVSDQDVLHNFHLFGPGVDRMTDVDTTGTVVWEVTFQDASTYTFRCDPHFNTMRGTFTVGNVPPPPPPPPGRMSGKVSAKTITLNSSGSRVRSVVENTYRIAVADLSRKQNFHLTGPGVNKRTAVAAITRKTWTLRLRPGRYTYRSDRNQRLRRTFTVRASSG